MRESEPNDSVAHSKDASSDDFTKAADDSHPIEEQVVADDNLNLTPMDWASFEKKYMEALKRS